MKSVFPISELPLIKVTGRDYCYQVRRIFCVGRNYVEHALELGNAVERKQPFYFTKSPFSLLDADKEFNYPPMTKDLHHEIELVVAIAKPLQKATREDIEGSIFGYACGLDMTRRDLQNFAKKQGKPWDVSKDFDGSAIIGEITEAKEVSNVKNSKLKLFLNDRLQQMGKISDMIHSVEEILLDLSRYTHLGPGDLIMTGTPAGVSAVKKGDILIAQIDGLADLKVKISES